MGTKLARDLVTMDHWIGMDVSPDVRHPGDLKQLHTADFVTANTQYHYYATALPSQQIPVIRQVTHYRQTGHFNCSPTRRQCLQSVTELTKIDINNLSRVKC